MIHRFYCGDIIPQMSCFHHLTQKIPQLQQTPGHWDAYQKNLHNELNQPIPSYYKEIKVSYRAFCQNQVEIIHVNFSRHPFATQDVNSNFHPLSYFDHQYENVNEDMNHYYLPFKRKTKVAPTLINQNLDFKSIFQFIYLFFSCV